MRAKFFINILRHSVSNISTKSAFLRTIMCTIFYIYLSVKTLRYCFLRLNNLSTMCEATIPLSHRPLQTFPIKSMTYMSSTHALKTRIFDLEAIWKHAVA